LFWHRIIHSISNGKRGMVCLRFFSGAGANTSAATGSGSSTVHKDRFHKRSVGFLPDKGMDNQEYVKTVGPLRFELRTSAV
jgi:hypothetical protein